MLLFQVMKRVKGHTIILVERKGRTAEKIFEGIATDWNIEELGINQKYGSNDVIGVGGDLATSTTTVLINGDLKFDGEDWVYLSEPTV